jgi:anti-sigma B factor antagonist
MGIEINIRDVGDIKVVDLQGDLDTMTAPDCQKTLVSVIEEGAKKIILNGEKLNYMSSAGLRVILLIAKKMNSDNGTLKLCCLNDAVNDVFEMSGFSGFLNIVKSEAEAFDSI